MNRSGCEIHEAQRLEGARSHTVAPTVPSDPATVSVMTLRQLLSIPLLESFALIPIQDALLLIASRYVKTIEEIPELLV